MTCHEPDCDQLLLRASGERLEPDRSGLLCKQPSEDLDLMILSTGVMTWKDMYVSTFTCTIGLCILNCLMVSYWCKALIDYKDIDKD